MARILVVGLNPSWQKILEFESVTAGIVNRAEQVTELASGKGLNTSRVLRRFGHEVWLLQVLGGRNGQKISDYCRRESIHSMACEASQETRTCLTLVDHATGMVTELIEPFSVSPDASAEEQLGKLVSRQNPGYDALLYCGTVPAGVDPRIYEEIHKHVTARLSIVDSVRITPGDFLNRLNYIKINRHEFEELQSRFPGLMAGDRRHPVFLMTDEAGLARRLQAGQGRIEERCFQVPRLSHVLNPIGAGDAVTAGLTHYLLSGFPVDEAFRHALAMGSASCLRLEPAAYDNEDYENILGEIRMT